MNHDISRSPVAMSGAGMSQVGPDQRESSRPRSGGQPLQLTVGEAVGIAADAALGAPERKLRAART